jgi:ribosomal protein S18 acetylase RimI-like enzyme
LDFTVRQMTELDFPAVAEIEAGVFTDWYRLYRRDTTPIAERTIQQLSYATSIDPEGNSVAVAADGSIVGFILARTWGSVGWFGTFGVPTQFQRLGIGTALVDRTLSFLTSRSTTIGLETMPESGPNMAFYSRSGFALTYPTLLTEMSLIQESDRLRGMDVSDVTAWSEETDGEVALEEIRGISDALLAGLDYSAEVVAMNSYGFGNTLLSHGAGGRLDGFAIVRTAPFRNENAPGQAFVHAMCIRPGAPEREVLLDLLRQIWTIATPLGLSRLIAGVNTRHLAAVSALYDAGFRPMRAAIRMALSSGPQDVFHPTDAFEVSRWAG